MVSRTLVSPMRQPHISPLQTKAPGPLRDGILEDHFISPSPLTRSRIRQNAGRLTRILANAATFYWQGIYEMVSSQWGRRVERGPVFG